MDVTRILGILLIVAGVAGLAYGSFSYTKDTQKAQLGNFKLTIAEKKEVDIPTWVEPGGDRRRRRPACGAAQVAGLWVSYNTGEYLLERHSVKNAREAARRYTLAGERFARMAAE